MDTMAARGYKGMYSALAQRSTRSSAERSASLRQAGGAEFLPNPTPERSFQNGFSDDISCWFKLEFKVLAHNVWGGASVNRCPRSQGMQRMGRTRYPPI